MMGVWLSDTILEDARWCAEIFDPMTRARGWRALAVAFDDSYQGEAAAVIIDDQGRLGVLEWWWGSCSHCDPYETDAERQGFTWQDVEASEAHKVCLFDTVAQLHQWSSMGRTQAHKAARAALYGCDDMTPGLASYCEPLFREALT